MMSFLRLWCCLVLLLSLPMIGRSQASSLRVKTISDYHPDTIIKLDTLSIYPGSFSIKCKSGKPLEESAYDLNFARSELKIRYICDDSLIVKYRVFPMDLSKVYALRDTSAIYNRTKGDRDNYLITSARSQGDLFGGTGLNKSGSISRGVSFGNNQDLGVNSTLNLELSGQIAPNLKLLASVSDDNLPIQPDGNTNKLREFDQVFIQVYNDRFKMIAGDFWLYKPDGYFMKYKKRAQGLTVNYQWTDDTTKVWKSQFSGALSRGKFQRQIIQGVEGNQGPYRLVGAENEPFIIVLSGTEKVFIDGKQMERGQEYDYVINYNTSEVTFTSRNQITKDSRIVIEFQYSDQNYARSLVQTSTVYETKKMKFWINGYSEQDAKNQSLQQELSISQKQLLAEIGDTLSLARTSSIDSVGFFENQNLYKIVTVNGYDSVLIYSVDPDSAYVRATFEFVGAQKGDYRFSNYNALGRVYVWVEPILGVSQGDYAASRLIVTPKKRQMVSSGVKLFLTPKLTLETEVSYTKNDLNTFSSGDSEDDQSVAGYAKLIGDVPLSKDTIPKWVMRTKLSVEARELSFIPIEQYRAVEFDRDWNTRSMGYLGNELSSVIGVDFMNKHGNFNFEGQQYLIGTDYKGLRANVDGKWNRKGLRANWDGSYLSSETDRSNAFLRHRAEISQSLGWIKIGFKDDHEQNKFRSNILDPTSYEFFDYQFYIANGDSIKNKFKLFYRERYDKKSDSSNLVAAAKARSVGGEIGFTQWKNHKLNVITSYRELTVQDPTLILTAPENTLLGRIEYEMKIWKGALTWNTFYEAGSGLELKREFLYIQVNDGQGVYTWIDYNGDGIKDLNEFEISQFVDQANFIRVFTPSNEYVKTYSNELNQSIYLRPQRFWGKKKKGVLKFVSRFSDQARVRIKRKTNNFNTNEAFNPFAQNVSDTSLVSTNSNIRNTLFFNRTSSIFGAEYAYQNVNSKTLLASGFDSRSNEYQEVSLRLNIKRKFTVKVSGKIGEKKSEADYTSGRDYAVSYSYLEPSLIYQPNTIMRISLDGRGSEKRNSPVLGGELARVMELGANFKYNQREKGSLQGGFKGVQINYTGVQNSALGFEMLEGLKPGMNFTWNVGYQRSISKSLQLSIQYNGRKSQDNRMIHSGGMEVRAFF
ncbi:MAG: hypothetical protein ACJA0U_001740 [Salibacteraceae bacterium]|jgi:hypothetical protein